MKGIALFLFIVACRCCFGLEDTNVIAAGDWSKPVSDSRGCSLRGRLLICEGPWRGVGQKIDTAVYLELQDWVIPPRSTNDYYLSCTFTIDPPTNHVALPEHHIWQGTLTLPKMKIPVRRP